jgi:dihydrofolate reductase
MLSLDGFLEGPEGAMDWFPPDDAAEWEQEFEVIAGVDTVLLGRGMYPGYANYWRGVLSEPAKHSKNEVAYASWADETRHVVFSRSLTSSDWSNTEFRRDAANDVPELKAEPGQKLIVYGGAIFASFLIEEGLVDEYHLVVNPVLLGGGKPLFKNLSTRRKLERVGVTPLPSGSVWLTYRPKR